MELLEAWKNGGLCLVDLRTTDDYSVVHLIGSTNIPGNEFHDRMQELPERVS
jgi:rhodanese-related sulfurtransferase